MRLRMLCENAVVSSSQVILLLLILSSLLFLSSLLMLTRQTPPRLPLSQSRDSSLYEKDGGVVLLGDSLIHESCYRFDLIGKLRSKVRYQLGYIDQGINGDTIHGISARLEGVLEFIDSTLPTAVFLLWDSDVSDIDEDAFPYLGPMYLRYRYSVTLSYVIQRLLSKNVYLVVSGPGLLPFPSKTDMLESYKAINVEICKDFGVDYIDLRSKFLGVEANNNTVVTVDGEHLNDLGVSIVAQEFSDYLLKWRLNTGNEKSDLNFSKSSSLVKATPEGLTRK